MRNEAELVPSPRHHSSHPAFHKAILEPESSGRELAARPRTASLHEGWSNHPCPCGSGKKDKLLSRLDRRALVAGPTHEHLGRRQECAAVKQARKSLGRWLRSPALRAWRAARARQSPPRSRPCCRRSNGVPPQGGGAEREGPLARIRRVSSSAPRPKRWVEFLVLAFRSHHLGPVQPCSFDGGRDHLCEMLQYGVVDLAQIAGRGDLD